MAAAFEKDANAYAAQAGSLSEVPFIAPDPSLSRALSGTGMVSRGAPNSFGSIGGGGGGGGGGASGGGGAQSSAETPQEDQSPTQNDDEIYPAPGPSPIPWRAEASATNLIFPDISHWNRIQDWKALNKASTGIIVMKVRQVSIDPMFSPWLKEAEERKMIVIGYAFGYGGVSGAVQADAFLKNFSPKPGRIMMLDLERNPPNFGKSMTVREANDFVERIRARTGSYPLLYTSASFPRTGALAKCPRYLAKWGSEPSGADIWQFTNGISGPPPHTFPGIGHCDINRLKVTYAKLRRWAGLDQTVAAAK